MSLFIKKCKTHPSVPFTHLFILYSVTSKSHKTRTKICYSLRPTCAHNIERKFYSLCEQHHTFTQIGFFSFFTPTTVTSHCWYVDDCDKIPDRQFRWVALGILSLSLIHTLSLDILVRCLKFYSWDLFAKKSRERS